MSLKPDKKPDHPENRAAAEPENKAGAPQEDQTGSEAKPQTPAASGGQELNEELVLDALRPVVDPELGINVVDLGLIYGADVDRANGIVTVRMTLTSPMCPVGPQLMAAVKEAAESLPDVKEAMVDLVWSPPWDPRQHASEEARAMMGIWS
ncbi:MAG: DUF59 domain-containing protein [Candidatus Eisenbacteria bacterium]|nr:DUF59 domain-containing protein [Candidatus Eisenbacteria bacterium]